MTELPQEVQQELARLRRYDEELSKVMNPDFKDWFENSKEEWPEVAAWVITNLREREELAWKHLELFIEEVENSK